MRIGKRIKWAFSTKEETACKISLVKQADVIHSRVIQLFNNINATGKDKPISCGTASIVTIEGRVFLLTAAHVADIGDLSVACPASLSKVNPIYMSLEGSRLKSVPPNGNRFKDQKDWGLIALADEVIRGFDQLGLRLSFFASKSIAKYYSFVGFPASKCKVVSCKEKKEIKSRPYAYTSKEVEDDVYAQYGLDKRINIVLPFNREKVFFEETPSCPMTFPDMHAMSGSPILNEWGEIVGVFTGSLQNNGFLVGTRAYAIFDDLLSELCENSDINRDSLIK